MNIDNALVMLYKKELLNKDEEKEIYKLIPYKICKGYIEKNTFYTYDSEEDNTVCYDNIEYLEEGNVKECYAYAFPLDLDALSEELKQNFEEDYIEFENFFKEQEFYLAKRLSDNLTKTLIKYSDSDTPKEVSMRNFNDFLEIYDHVCDLEENNRLMTTDELYDIVSSSVKCQDSNIKEIITNIAKNQRMENSLIKTNMLICGPSGVGKTKVFDILNDHTNIPVVFEEASDYHKLNHHNINDTLLNLYLAANSNIEVAKRGVVVIDNLDFMNKGYEEFMENFMQEFKSHLIGEIFLIQTPSGECIPFDTSNITFVLIGNFMNLNYSNTIGYKYNEKINIKDIKTQKELHLYPEFNNDNIIIFNNLDINNLITIIKESDISDLLLYKNLFSKYNIELTYTDTLIDAIAKEAYQLNIGAKGIKKVIERLFKDATYYAFSSKEYKELIIDEETLKDNKKYILR